jgi:hypothetical protein
MPKLKFAMMKLITTVARFVLNLLLPFLAVGFGREAWRVVRSITLTAPRPSAFLLGAGGFIPLWFVGQRLMPRVVSYLTTLEHELTHILVGLLFLIRPVSIRVTATQGGEVVLTGSNLWITLAPYFLPTISFLILPFAWLASNEAERILLAVLGASVIYHLLSTWSEVGVVQSDFRKAGIAQSLWLIPVANLICYGMILAFVVGTGGGIIHFIRRGLLDTSNAITEIRQLLLLT